MKEKRKSYVSPAMEIIPLTAGSLMVDITSAGTDAPQIPGGGVISTRSPHQGGRVSSVTSTDLDNLINDILTVEQ
jgi:hypothetical protein